MKNNTTSFLKSTRARTIPFKRNCPCACLINYRSSYSGKTHKFAHSGSIPRNEKCMCRLRNIAMRDYQESVTTGQTDAGQNDPYVPICFAGDSKITYSVLYEFFSDES